MLENDVGLFDPRGFGIIRREAKEVYQECERRGKKFVISSDNASYSSELAGHFVKIDTSSIDDILLSGKIFNTSNVLGFLLDIHRAIQTMPVKLNKDYRFTEVMFLELTTHVSHTTEYLALMYMYLLNMGIVFSEFYIIIGFPTNKYNFIEDFIFHSQKSSPVEILTSTVDIKTFNLVNIDNEMIGKKILVISENDLFEKEIKKYMEEVLKIECFVFGDLGGYSSSRLALPTAVCQHITFITIKNINLYFANIVDAGSNLPSSDVDMVIMDSRIKIQENALYSGNIPIPMRINDDYINACGRKILSQKKTKFYKYIQGKEEVIRGIFYRSPIIDIINFYNHGISIKLLYTRYYKSEEISSSSLNNFMNILGTETKILQSLEFYEKAHDFGKSVISDIHPLLISIIDAWNAKKYPSSDGQAPKSLPRLSILLFVASILTPNKALIEVKDHGMREHESDISQTSQFGKDFSEYIKRIKERRTIELPEMGKRTKKLLSLIDLYKITNEEIAIPELDDFVKYFSRLMLDSFPSFLLTLKFYQKYTSSYNEHLNWYLNASITPNKIFPITVFSTGTAKKIQFFIPILES